MASINAFCGREFTYARHDQTQCAYFVIFIRDVTLYYAYIEVVLA